MKSRILKLAAPVVTSYTSHAHLLSILGLKEETKPWIYSNYIQIYANKDLLGEDWADFYFPYPFELRTVDTCHWISTQKLLRNTVLSIWDTFIDAMTYFIDQEAYLHVMLDQYYVPNTKNYNKNHYLHDIMIYGYDDEKKIVYACDFVGIGRYTRFELSYDSVESAFADYVNCNSFDYLYENVYLYKLKEETNYEADFMNVLNSLELYLEGTAPEYWTCYSDTTKNKRFYGINCYQSYLDYADVCMKEKIDMNTTLFYLLLDHKHIMTERMKYFIERGAPYDSFIEQFREIENMTKVLLNLVIKYNMNKKPNEEIFALLNNAKQMEVEALTGVLKASEVLRK